MSKASRVSPPDATQYGATMMKVCAAIGILAGFLFPLICAVPEAPKATDARTIIGTLDALNSSTISILPPPANRPAPTSGPAVETFPIDAVTVVRRQVIRPDHVNLIAW